MDAKSLPVETNNYVSVKGKIKRHVSNRHRIRMKNYIERKEGERLAAETFERRNLYIEMVNYTTDNNIYVNLDVTTFLLGGQNFDKHLEGILSKIVIADLMATNPALFQTLQSYIEIEQPTTETSERYDVSEFVIHHYDDQLTRDIDLSNSNTLLQPSEEADNTSHIVLEAIDSKSKDITLDQEICDIINDKPHECEFKKFLFNERISANCEVAVINTDKSKTESVEIYVVPSDNEDPSLKNEYHCILTTNFGGEKKVCVNCDKTDNQIRKLESPYQLVSRLNNIPPEMRIQIEKEMDCSQILILQSFGYVRLTSCPVRKISSKRYTRGIASNVTILSYGENPVCPACDTLYAGNPFGFYNLIKEYGRKSKRKKDGS